MNAMCTLAMAIGALAIAAQASGQVTLYEHSGFRGQSATVDRPAGSLERYGFNNRASSAVVSGEPWEVCDGPGFRGRCTVLQPGRYESLGAMNDGITSARPVSSRGAPTAGHPAPPPPAGAQVTFYERREFRGRSFTADGPIRNFERYGFNNRASSAVISGGSWEVCDDRGFGGRCAVLRPGRYSSLREMGLNNSISSARPADTHARAPDPGRASGEVTLYEHSGFRGQSITIDRPRRNLERVGASNSASSVVVAGEPWELCDGPGFSGRCVVLRPGRYQSLGAMGLNDSISSLRPAHR